MSADKKKAAAPKLLPTARSSKTVDPHEFIYLIYGPPKIGKTTLAAGFEKAVFFATEPGHKFQSVFKIDLQDWNEFKLAARELLTVENEFKCVVIDTIDNAWKFAENFICQRENIKHINELGYGKGYDMVKKELHNVLNAITQRGYGVVFISHDKTIEFQDDDGINRLKTTTTLTGSAKNVVHPLCDFILYCHADKDGNRRILARPIKSIEAGDRSGKLPQFIPMSFESLNSAIQEINKPTKTSNKGEK